jgi:hypothetical protein
VPLGGLTTADILAYCAAVRAALTPWDTGRTAPSFIERVDQSQGHLTPDQIRTLDEIRTPVDPTGLFRGDITPTPPPCTDPPLAVPPPAGHPSGRRRARQRRLGSSLYLAPAGREVSTCTTWSTVTWRDDDLHVTARVPCCADSSYCEQVAGNP